MSADLERAGLASRFGSALASFVLEVSCHGRGVLLSSVVSFAASLRITPRDPAIRSDKSQLFLDDLPSRVVDDRFCEAFQQRHENVGILLVIDEAEAIRDAPLLQWRALHPLRWSPSP